MKPVKVSQLNKYIKTILQSDPLLSNVSVSGEVSNLKFHGSGHVYFSLKDSISRINCFLPAERAEKLRYDMEEGIEIIASGYIYLYEKGGSYSLNVTEITIEGEGNLAAAFERLKKKLAAEGLFDQKYKKTLPFFPDRVALVTSDTGAAVWDMIRTIRNKNGHVDIILCPCLVQGDGAAEDIEAAIRAVNRMAFPPDVIIAGRGGGSGEDLWAFNEERVARSIFESKIPVISAVGHETDFTIADFVADYRAATPTAAAEAAVPDTDELRISLQEELADISTFVERHMSILEASLEVCSPEKLSGAIELRVLEYERDVIETINEIRLGFKDIIYREEMRIERIKTQADSIAPQRILEMGYGAVMDSNNKYIKSISEVGLSDKINLRLVDGSLKCTVDQITEERLEKNERKD